jgi:hypothetical protein
MQQLAWRTKLRRYVAAHRGELRQLLDADSAGTFPRSLTLTLRLRLRLRLLRTLPAERVQLF